MAMSNEELAVHVQQGRQDDVLPLWEGVQRFVYREAGRWARAWQGRGGVEVDDLIQAGFLALLEAVEGYQTEKGVFLTWYGYFLKKSFSEALDVHRQPDPLQGAVSFDTPVADGLTVADTLPGDGGLDGADRKIFLEQLSDALTDELAKLPAQQRDVLERRFYGEQTRKQIAEAEELTPYKVQALEERAMTTLRKPRAARRLAQFLDDRTDFYGLHGVHSVEGAVIHREWVEGSFSEP